MKLLIDTNVLLDMVFERNGYDISVELFRKVREQEIPACILDRNGKTLRTVCSI